MNEAKTFSKPVTETEVRPEEEAEVMRIVIASDHPRTRIAPETECEEHRRHNDFYYVQEFHCK